VRWLLGVLATLILVSVAGCFYAGADVSPQGRGGEEVLGVEKEKRVVEEHEVVE